MLSIRPSITEMVFQLYGRSLHPELFNVYQARSFDRGAYQADVRITNAGHLVTWRHRGLTLTELAVSEEHPLPQKRRLLSHRLKGQRTERVQCRGGIRYEVSIQLEVVDPQVFWNFQQEITDAGQRQGLLHTFGSRGRIAMGAVSYLNVETRSRSMLVQAFHTFPDDYAIVKSQSLFELPS